MTFSFSFSSSSSSSPRLSSQAQPSPITYHLFPFSLSLYLPILSITLFISLALFLSLSISRYLTLPFSILSSILPLLFLFLFLPTSLKPFRHVLSSIHPTVWYPINSRSHSLSFPPSFFNCVLHHQQAKFLCEATGLVYQPPVARLFIPFTRYTHKHTERVIIMRWRESGTLCLSRTNPPQPSYR